ncbi:hypothetical protein QBC47DRAFT_368158 [Echria macrotheca]|uniref:Urease accessory protein UreF n=1 Tax=Echria macrotheca TaxID=438768 RepID=A0AAJ0BM81_9PEZI|nr:hypothetical protein QBC47DRAFT_368158 [Echria macrotheca]
MSSHPNTTTSNCDNNDIEAEIADLERRLAEAKAKLSSSSKPLPTLPNKTPTSQATHFLLLLSDSALPLGSFAFSSGLESYLAHHKANLHPSSSRPSLSSFLPLSVSSYASTTLPFVLAAHRDPSTSSLAYLDDTLDASIICTVGRRASVAQGRALLSIWERSFSASLGSTGGLGLGEYSALLKRGDGKVSAHLAPLFGAVGRLVGLSLEQTAYVFMLGHVKALVSAAVRAGVLGPYQAQKVLAGREVRELIGEVVEREWETEVERAGQNVPVMDLWFGRHEVLYSRIFNS